MVRFSIDTFATPITVTIALIARSATCVPRIESRADDVGRRLDDHAGVGAVERGARPRSCRRWTGPRSARVGRERPVDDHLLLQLGAAEDADGGIGLADRVHAPPGV